MNFRPNLSQNEILIYNSVVGNSRTFLLSPNLQRNTEVHKTLTQICICGTALIVAVSASLTNDGNLSHFDFKSHTYSVPLRRILPTYSANIIYFQLKIKQNGNLQGRFFILYQYSILPLSLLQAETRLMFHFVILFLRHEDYLLSKRWRRCGVDGRIIWRRSWACWYLVYGTSRTAREKWIQTPEHTPSSVGKTAALDEKKNSAIIM